MNKNVKSLLLAGCVLGMLGIHSCTNLEEEVFDQIPQDQFGVNQEQLNALLGPLYGGLGDYFGNHNEWNTSTDEQIVPTRGGDWKDGDRWKRIHEHQWSPVLEDGALNGYWTWCYNNVTSINQRLTNPAITENARTVAELRALRAFYHYLAMDFFGRVIIADRVGGDESPQQRTRPEVFAWVENELLEALPLLSDVVGGVNYGRMNKYVVQMILAKMYLNAEVYTGTPQWARAAAFSDSVVASGRFSLVGDFFSNFSVNNTGSPETILASPMDRTRRGGMNIQMRTLHYIQQLQFNLGNAPWNGYATMAEFYNSFDNEDIRKDMWMVGQQFDANGQPLLDDEQPLAFTVDIPAFEMPAGVTGRLAGARSQKYEIQRNNPVGDQDNDFIIYRLADAIMMRGEANFRLGNVAAALEDFNTIRNLRGVEPYTAATLTLDEILAERGREFAWEYHRRQDLIRFGQFNRAWQFKPASDPTKNVFPIPFTQINLNPNLTQNPGY